MRKALCVLAFSLASISPALADTDSPATQLRYLIGSWDCVTNGATPITEAMTVEALPGGAWLHGTGTSQANGQSLTDESYLEWDARTSRWILIQIYSNGTYAVSTSTSPTLSGSTWTAYGASAPGATLSENAATQYTLEQSGIEGGRKITLDEVCTRQ